LFPRALSIAIEFEFQAFERTCSITQARLEQSQPATFLTLPEGACRWERGACLVR
jgi:hypothetical protein